MFTGFICSKNLDVIGINETWLRPSDTKSLLDEVNPTEFQPRQIPHRDRKGGGVAVFVGVHFVLVPSMKLFKTSMLSFPNVGQIS